ncbi:MAG: glycosyltransferase [Bacteroidales bacterium]|nr:glycosyltransferase [Bacteroidales bacterium]
MNLLVFGNFGFKKNSLDGQTVKTRNLLSLLKKNSIHNVYFFDTADLATRKILIFKLFWLILKSHKIFYLPANKNLQYFFPILYFICKLFGKDIYYFIIGGWLPEFLKDKYYHRKALKSLTAIFSETSQMIVNLSQWYAFNNVYLFPNFRINNFSPSITEPDGLLRLVFMSRVKKIKGTDLLIQLSKKIIENKGSDKILIDFYGPLNEYEGDSFEDDIKEIPIFAYKGVLQPSEIYSTLEKYDCMVFPTLYKGEGFPGAIVDAYISGIPVIASNIRYNSEFIVDGVTGFLFDPEKIDDLYGIIQNLMENIDSISELKLNAFAKSKEYSEDVAWSIINQHIFKE